MRTADPGQNWTPLDGYPTAGAHIRADRRPRRRRGRECVGVVREDSRVHLTLFSGDDRALLDEALRSHLQSAGGAAGARWLVAAGTPAALGYRQALAQGSAPVGVRVLSFGELAQELLARSGAARAISPFERELLVGALLERGGRAAFAGALARLIGELEAACVSPEQLARACARKRLESNARIALLRSVHGAYRSLLQGLGLEDRDRALAGAVAAFKHDRQLPGEPLELLIEAPAPGAPKAYLALCSLAAERLVIDAPGRARAAAPGVHGYPSERHERAALLDRIQELLGAGLAPQEIAVVHRRPQRLVPALSALLDRAGVPYNAALVRPFGSSALGAATLGWLRIAAGAGELEDLLAYLRHPGARVPREAVARLEGACLRAGIEDAQGALALLGQQAPAAAALALGPEREGAEVDGGGAGLVAPLLAALFTDAHAPLQAALGREGEAEAAALRAAAGALARLSDLEAALRGSPDGQARALADRLGRPARLAAMLARLRFHARLAAGAGREALVLCDPTALAAHRPRAVLLCGMNEGLFPAAARPRGFLSEQERALLAGAGIGLSASDDQLAAERALFAGCLAGAGRELAISFSESGDDGRPLAPSLLLEELPSGAPQPAGGMRPAEGRVKRAAAAPVARSLTEQETGERLRGYAAALEPPRRLSATELECYAHCPQRWLIERALRAEEVAPEATERAEGELAHRLLHGLFRTLEGELGEARITHARLPRARAIIAELLEREQGEGAGSPCGARSAQAQLLGARLREQLDRYLELACDQQRQLSATHLELDFGRPGGLAALALDGELEISGRIDRIDASAQTGAVVYDYKRSARATFPAAKWVQAGTIQIALYMRAARQLLDLTVVGGLFQPLGGSDLRPRGALREDVDLPSVRTDRLAEQQLAELERQTIAVARLAGRQLAEALIEPRPLTCSSAGCAHPQLCRYLR